MVMWLVPVDGGKPENCRFRNQKKRRQNVPHNELVEKAVENDEKLMEKYYFEKGTLDEDEMREGIKQGMIHHDVFPGAFVMGRLARKQVSGRKDGICIDNAVSTPREAKAWVNHWSERNLFDPTQPAVIVCF